MMFSSECERAKPTPRTCVAARPSSVAIYFEEGILKLHDPLERARAPRCSEKQWVRTLAGVSLHERAGETSSTCDFVPRHHLHAPLLET